MKTPNRIIYASLIAILFFSCNTDKKNVDPIDQRVEQLLAQMTLQEKIGQLDQFDGWMITEEVKDKVRDGRMGSIINCDPELVNEVQRIAVEESRLGIPLLYARDVIHGFKTIFPIPLAQAAGFNPEIVKEGARIAAKEASATGIRYTFAPMIDITRDPRWGRIAESLGEDPYLASILGVAMVEGFQGNDLSDPERVAACAKHFAAYGFSEGGRDYNTVNMPEQQLREVVFPPFEAVAKAGCATFMSSFNELNGVPASGNEFLFRQVLRNEWGYDGMVISDYFSIEQMRIQGYCPDLPSTAVAAIKAGIDMDMMSAVYEPYLDSLVRVGAVQESLVDDAVRNVLKLKFKLGLFDNPYTDLSKRETTLYAEDHLASAKQAAIESAVLLKNEGNVLPLKENTKTIAVIGQLADSPADQLGTWVFDGEPEHSVTPLTAIKAACGEQINVIYEPAYAYSRDKNTAGIDKAVQAAKKADVVLLFVGEEALISGEARCRADINLPGMQNELVKAVSQANKPVVMIVMAGRPLTIGEQADAVSSVLYAFHGGTMAGPALSDLIFGKAVPSGKLPVTFPKAVGQIPIYYNEKQTGRPPSTPVLLADIPVGAKQTSLGFSSYWLDAGVGPLYPFGYGLSYTTFEYSDITLSAAEMQQRGEITVSCNITNTGNYDAAEIVQLYIHDITASLTRPMKELKGFQKIYLKAGESKTVTFTITEKELSFWNADMKRTAEPGDFTVFIAPNSISGLEGRFTLK